MVTFGKDRKSKINTQPFQDIINDDSGESRKKRLLEETIAKAKEIQEKAQKELDKLKNHHEMIKEIENLPHTWEIEDQDENTITIKRQGPYSLARFIHWTIPRMRYKLISISTDLDRVTRIKIRKSHAIRNIAGGYNISWTID